MLHVVLASRGKVSLREFVSHTSVATDDASDANDGRSIADSISPNVYQLQTGIPLPIPLCVINAFAVRSLIRHLR